MRKVFIGIAVVIVLLTFSLVFFACDNDDQTSSRGMTRHEVRLDLNNYLTYLNVTESTYNLETIPRFTFSGCLSYAFFNNVTVTISYQGYSSYGTSPIETTTVSLNANGQGEVYLRSVDTAYISSISGSVVYWI